MLARIVAAAIWYVIGELCGDGVAAVAYGSSTEPPQLENGCDIGDSHCSMLTGSSR